MTIRLRTILFAVALLITGAGVALSACLPMRAADSGHLGRTCPPNEWPLSVGRDGNDVFRLYVNVESSGQPSLLLFDTGCTDSLMIDSMHTLVAGNGRVGLAGCPLALPFRAVDVEHTFETHKVVGIAGFDLLEGRTILVDVARARLTFLERGDPTLAEPGFTRVPLEIRLRSALISVKLDGTPVRLVVDTGCDELLLVDPNATAGHGQYGEGADAYGNVMHVDVTEQTLTLGERAPRRVRVQRSKTWPALTIHPRADDVYGVLGLNDLGPKRFILDFRGSALYVER